MLDTAFKLSSARTPIVFLGQADSDWDGARLFAALAEKEQSGNARVVGVGQGLHAVVEEAIRAAASNGYVCME